MSTKQEQQHKDINERKPRIHKENKTVERGTFDRPFKTFAVLTTPIAFFQLLTRPLTLVQLYKTVGARGGWGYLHTESDE